MKPLLGYSDKLSVRPGDRIAFNISAEDGQPYTAQLVRLICGGAHSEHPTFKEAEVPSVINNQYPGRRQSIVQGSFISIEAAECLTAANDFTLLVTFMPTAPGAGLQHLVSRWNQGARAGWTLHITADSRLAFSYGDVHQSQIIGDQPLESGQWYQAMVRVAPSRRSIELVCHLYLSTAVFHTPVAIRKALTGIHAAPSDNSTPLLIGAALGNRRDDGSIVPVDCFSGRIEAPIVYRGELSDAEAASVFAGERPEGLADRLLGDWDFSVGVSGTAITDWSPNALHGRTHNLPLRAVKGSQWNGSAFAWKEHPEGYAAIHFHRDDLYDCGWSTDIAYVVDDDLRSGIYAVRLRQGNDEDYIPFFVAPPKRKPQSKVAFVVPTYTYLAYANLRVLGSYEAMCLAKTNSGLSDEAFARTLMTGPGTEDYVRLMESNPELGLSTYDHHADGTPVHFSSWLRPILSMRPKSILWTFCADLLITDWLANANIEFDVITDDLLHFEGAELLRDYPVVISGNHPEYVTTEQLDAIRSYLDGGGRFLYLGGNGYYWKTAVHSSVPAAIEIRRARGATQTWVSEPGEDHYAFTGELGGIWRDLGRAPQQLFGVGFIAQGSSSSRYRIVSGARNGRASFAFEGIDEEIIGDFGCFDGGAAGQEIDQGSVRRGTPPHAVVLARSDNHGPQMIYVMEEMLGDNPHPDHYRAKVSADVVFFETKNGGAVFSVGSMAWCGSLAHNSYDNNVARMTSNVLRRFLDPGGFDAKRGD